MEAVSYLGVYNDTKSTNHFLSRWQCQQHKVSPCLGVYDDNSRVSLMSWSQYPKQPHTSCMQWHDTVSPVSRGVTTAVAWRDVTWLQSLTSQQWRSRNSTGCQSHDNATCLITPSPPDTDIPAPCTGCPHVCRPAWELTSPAYVIARNFTDSTYEATEWTRQESPAEMRRPTVASVAWALNWNAPSPAEIW